jgi:hypothetical protein
MGMMIAASVSAEPSSPLRFFLSVNAIGFLALSEG